MCLDLTYSVLLMAFKGCMAQDTAGKRQETTDFMVQSNMMQHASDHDWMCSHDAPKLETVQKWKMCI